MDRWWNYRVDGAMDNWMEWWCQPHFPILWMKVSPIPGSAVWCLPWNHICRECLSTHTSSAPHQTTGLYAVSQLLFCLLGDVPELLLQALAVTSLAAPPPSGLQPAMAPVHVRCYREGCSGWRDFQNRNILASHPRNSRVSSDGIKAPGEDMAISLLGSFNREFSWESLGLYFSSPPRMLIVLFRTL